MKKNEENKKNVSKRLKVLHKKEVYNPEALK
jgi:hypothetical protein